ncbi:MAG: SPFH domain-containing protein [Oscillospiraceae bacterium]
MEVGIIIILSVVIFFLFVIIAQIKVVPQAQVYVIERVGSYYATWSTGLHFLIPFVDRVAKKVSLKEFVVDFKPQPVITKDNVTMQIDTVVFYQVTDAKLFTYGVNNPMSAIENLTATTLRNIIGDLELDSTLTSRETVNTKITALLDLASDKWGIKVNRVELKNILPPREIQDAMEKQMKAERERRETMLRAEGEKRSQILVAEGEKESQILRAQAANQTEILRAEAAKLATILNAEAVKEKKIKEAEGEAQAIEMVQNALAASLVELTKANPSKEVLAIKSLEAFAKAADGKATKIIIPSDLGSLAGLTTSVKEFFDTKLEN